MSKILKWQIILCLIFSNQFINASDSSNDDFSIDRISRFVYGGKPGHRYNVSVDTLTPPERAYLIKNKDRGKMSYTAAAVWASNAKAVEFLLDNSVAARFDYLSVVLKNSICFFEYDLDLLKDKKVQDKLKIINLLVAHKAPTEIAYRGYLDDLSPIAWVAREKEKYLAVLKKERLSTVHQSSIDYLNEIHGLLRSAPGSLRFTFITLVVQRQIN